MGKHEMTLGEYRDYCAEADARIASLTDAVRVLTEGLEEIGRQHLYSEMDDDTRRYADYFASHESCVTLARAALTTAKELTK